MTMAAAIAQVAHLYPGAPLHSTAYGTADGTMPYHLLMFYLSKIAGTLATARINHAQGQEMAMGTEHGAELHEEAFNLAYPP